MPDTATIWVFSKTDLNPIEFSKKCPLRRKRPKLQKRVQGCNSARHLFFGLNSCGKHLTKPPSYQTANFFHWKESRVTRLWEGRWTVSDPFFEGRWVSRMQWSPEDLALPASGFWHWQSSLSWLTMVMNFHELFFAWFYFRMYTFLQLTMVIKTMVMLPCDCLVTNFATKGEALPRERLGWGTFLAQFIHPFL